MHRERTAGLLSTLLLTIPATAIIVPSSQPLIAEVKICRPSLLRLSKPRARKTIPSVVEVVEYGREEEEHKNLGKYMMFGQNFENRFQLVKDVSNACPNSSQDFTHLSSQDFAHLSNFTHLGQDFSDACEYLSQDYSDA